MGRTIITEADVAALESGSRLVVDAETTITPPARDMARRRGIEVVDPEGTDPAGPVSVGGATAGTGATAGGAGTGAGTTAGAAGAVGAQPGDGHASGGPHAVHAHDASARHGGRPPRTLIVTAVGVNRPGVLAELSAAISTLRGDIQDMSQRITGGYFNAILVVDIHRAQHDFAEFRDALRGLSEPNDYVVNVIDARVFQAMHRI